MMYVTKLNDKITNTFNGTTIQLNCYLISFTYKITEIILIENENLIEIILNQLLVYMNIEYTGFSKIKYCL